MRVAVLLLCITYLASSDKCYLGNLEKEALDLLEANYDEKVDSILPSKTTGVYQDSFTSAMVAWALALTTGQSLRQREKTALQSQSQHNPEDSSWNSGSDGSGGGGSIRPAFFPAAPSAEGAGTDPSGAAAAAAAGVAAAAAGDMDAAWREIAAAFSGQQPDGLIPRATFPLTPALPVPPRDEGDDQERGGGGGGGGGGTLATVAGTLLPDAQFWNSGSQYNSTVMAGTTGVAAFPIHAEAVLQVFLSSPRAAADVLRLRALAPRLDAWHRALLAGPRRGGENGLVWSLHPWETGPVELAATPARWGEALDGTRAAMDAERWAPPDLPPGLRALPEYPGDDIYYPVLYLAECVAGQAGAGGPRPMEAPAPAAAASSAPPPCPFAVLDVGVNAALARSHRALYAIAALLEGGAGLVGPDAGLPAGLDLQELRERAERSEGALTAELWGTEGGAYAGRYLRRDREVVYQSTSVLKDVLPLFSKELSQPELSGTVSALVSRVDDGTSQSSFNCFAFPFSLQPCTATQLAGPPEVNLAVNFLVQRGLLLNSEISLSDWVKESSLSLMCNCTEKATLIHGTKNSSYSTPEGCSAANFSFSNVWYPNNGHSSLASSNLRSSLAAALTLSLMFTDSDEEITEAVIIRHSILFAVMVVELVFVFCIGAVCILFSFNLLRKIHMDDGALSSLRPDSDTLNLQIALHNFMARKTSSQNGSSYHQQHHYRPLQAEIPSSSLSLNSSLMEEDAKCIQEIGGGQERSTRVDEQNPRCLEDQGYLTARESEDALRAGEKKNQQGQSTTTYVEIARSYLPYLKFW